MNTKLIEKAVYELCIQANTQLCDDVFAKICNACANETNKNSKQALELILQNAKMSFETKKPLCQDTGQVLVFLKIGEDVKIKNLTKSINNAVFKAYKQNFYRKSIVKNALFERINTNTNIPCIIYTQIVKGKGLEIELLIKGAGAENASAAKMLSPTANEKEIIDFVIDTVKSAGAKACPPFFIGIGIGGTIEYSGLLSKKALLLDKNIDENHEKLAQKIQNKINNLNIGTMGLGGNFTALDVKILTSSTHIASMPITVTVNCHSSRHAKCKIENNKIKFYNSKKIRNYKPFENKFNDYIKLNTNEINKIRKLKTGQKVLLTGELYTARDMAHKMLVELIQKGKKLPVELKDKIIFYAGPCPNPKSEIIGSVGPTTSARMDKFMPEISKTEILATIGKGERSAEAIKLMQKNKIINFGAIGGIACLLSKKITKKEIIAFEDLGTEAIYRLCVHDFPVYVS
ncbi:MAG TPA: fumarate hydratase [Candidatus Gastranaerophilaceae bacterium]|nr:fumarate hydratase [Candidatus Gastranaerophilaceae bacterium]